MQEVAISMLSASSGVRVPSLREVERKSIMARARRFFVSRVDAYGGLAMVELRSVVELTMMALGEFRSSDSLMSSSRVYR